MKKYVLSAAIALCICELPTVLSAQTDSSRFDLGHLTLNKTFTQHVSIRGEDLEKMPFANLSEAIEAWLFGAYTVPFTLAYVVDGNPVTDVNIYPIYEIETVTFVNNAVASAAYGNNQKELVLITTKRGTAKGGMRMAAQAGWVRGTNYGTKTENGFYHQYYIGAYRNLKKLSFGISADWQRDFEPVLKYGYSGYMTPDKLQRWKLNGRFEWRPDQRNTIGLTLGYAPQRVVYSSYGDTVGYVASSSNEEHGYLLIPQLSWEGHWAKGLRNTFSAEYLRPWLKQNLEQTDRTGLSGGPTFVAYTMQFKSTHDHLVLRDNLSYEAVAGNWHIVPAIGFSYQHLDEKASVDEVQQVSTGGFSHESYEQKGSIFYITPAVDLSLAHALDIEAGVMVNAGGKVETGSDRVFPFVTGALDLLHLDGVAGSNSLKLFGSYARRPTLYLNDYSLNDFSNGGGNQSLYNIYHGMSGYAYINGSMNTPNFSEREPDYWTWETGAAFTTADGRVTVQYSYERRNLSFAAFKYNTSWGYEPWTETFHHIDLRFKVIDSKTISWLTGINASSMRSKGDTAGFQFTEGIPYGPTGDIAPARYSWTGGWVNRLVFGRFSAGLDLLYHLGTAGSYNVSKNTVAMPNVYAGYRFGLPHDRGLEVFAESRGLLMNTPTDLADGRRYYTLGASVAL